ncbi:MAG TPA: hypothetical protein VIJ40_02655 [Acidimicrobiales bacterium]
MLKNTSIPETGKIVEDGTIQGDVERLINVAAQLFSLIEGQVHDLGDELVSTFNENVRMNGRGVVKEEIIQSAANLDSSLQEIRDHLGREDARFTRRRQFLSRQFSKHPGLGGNLEAS